MGRVGLLLWLAAASPVEARLQKTVAGGATTTVDAWGADSVRVRVHFGAVIDVPAAQALLPTATPPPGTGEAVVEANRLTHGNIRVDVDNAGLVTVTRVSDQKVLLKQTAGQLNAAPPADYGSVDEPGATATCTMLPGTDLDPNDHGNDEGHAPAADAAACAARCLAHTPCFAFTFTRVGLPTDTCFLKGIKATNPSVRRASPGHVSGVCRQAPPPAPPAPYVRTGTGHVEFEGLGQGEAIYGMGEHRGSSRCTNQCVNTSLPIKAWDWEIQHSQDVNFLPNNGNAWIPFYQSTIGYGFLWNLASYGHFHVGADAISWSSNATLQIDYWVTTTAATTPNTAQPYADLMKHYADAAGPPPEMPFSYTGFWQCKLRYSSQEQILRIASEYVERNLPISVIVVDFHHWIHEGDWRFSTALKPSDGCWPDPTAMANQLEEMGINCAVSVWPDVQSDAINYVNMSSQGLLIRGADGKSKPSVQGKDYIDAFNPATRKYMFDQLVDGYISHGIDTFWMDATEPQGANIGEWFYRLDDGKTHKDNEVAMAWVQQYHRMAHDGLVAQGLEEIPPFLTRSAFAGSQRYGAILWSGDIESTFDELAVQVQVAQHVAMSGIYWWTTDIGGFRNGNPMDPTFRELIVRWFQFGAFCPIFRLHGDRGGPKDKDICGATGFNEVWTFGDTAYGAISSVMRLREDLRDYVHVHLRRAHDDGTPLLRPMVFEFTDPACENATDQFMFGDSWLVAPVLSYGSKSQRVYLPKLPTGQHWRNYYSNSTSAVQAGWQSIATPSLDAFPLFYRVFGPASEERGYGDFDFSHWRDGYHPNPRGGSEI